MELVILEGKMGPGTHSPDTLQAAHLPGIHWASFFLHSPLWPRPGTGVPLHVPCVLDQGQDSSGPFLQQLLSAGIPL